MNKQYFKKDLCIICGGNLKHTHSDDIKYRETYLSITELNNVNKLNEKANLIDYHGEKYCSACGRQLPKF